MEKFPCPNCKNDHTTLRRYKDAVCRTCLDIYGTKTKEGIAKYFFNRDEFGGIICFCEEVATDDFICYVDNKKCIAEEARFGGIVIRMFN